MLAWALWYAPNEVAKGLFNLLGQSWYGAGRINKGKWWWQCRCGSLCLLVELVTGQCRSSKSIQTQHPMDGCRGPGQLQLWKVAVEVKREEMEVED